jgi:uncharacterized protein (DUF934 family)
MLVKNRTVISDPWTTVADDAALPEGRPSIVSLDRWTRERKALERHSGGIGVRLRSDQSPAPIAEDLGRLALVALEFPKFTDGRAYSYARLLRERYGFRGELRAVGNILRDQLAFMTRCGFDVFDLPDGADADAWLESVDEISVSYQRATQRVTAVRDPGPEPVLSAQLLEPESVVVAMWAY